MSKGSPIVPIRIPAELLALIDADIERSIQCDQNPRDSRTVWILEAVREVLRHRERAKRSRKVRQTKRQTQRDLAIAIRRAEERMATQE